MSGASSLDVPFVVAIGGFYPWGFTAIPPQKTGNFADLSAEAAILLGFEPARGDNLAFEVRLVEPKTLAPEKNEKMKDSRVNFLLK